MWNSPEQANLKRAGYRPEPTGFSIGAGVKWIVQLPKPVVPKPPMPDIETLSCSEYGGTVHIREVLIDVLKTIERGYNATNHP